MKKRLSLLLLVLVFLMVGTNVFAASKTIKLATLDWEPYIGRDLKDNGYVAEIVREAFRRKGYTVKIKFLPWARVLKMAKDGKVDGYFPEYYSAERENEFLFSNEFPGGPLGFFKRKDSDISYNKLTDLKPYRIGVVRGYVNTKEFDAADYLKKEPALDDLTNIKKLLAGRIDLLVADKFVGLDLLERNLSNHVGDIEFVQPALELKPLYVCFPRTLSASQMYNKVFNAGLKEIKEDGTLDKILTKHGF